MTIHNKGIFGVSPILSEKITVKQYRNGEKWKCGLLILFGLWCVGVQCFKNAGTTVTCSETGVIIPVLVCVIVPFHYTSLSCLFHYTSLSCLFHYMSLSCLFHYTSLSCILSCLFHYTSLSCILSCLFHYTPLSCQHCSRHWTPTRITYLSLNITVMPTFFIHWTQHTTTKRM